MFQINCSLTSYIYLFIKVALDFECQAITIIISGRRLLTNCLRISMSNSTLLIKTSTRKE